MSQEQKNKRAAQQTLPSLMYPEDLHSQDGDNPVTHPDCIQMIIQRKSGASLKGLKRHLKNKYGGTASDSINKLGQALSSKLQVLNKLKTEKPTKEIQEKIEAEIKTITDRKAEIQNLQEKIVGLNTDEAKKNFADKVEVLGSKISAIGGGIVEASKDALKTFRSTNKGYNTAQPVRSISLPMPENLTYTEQVDWQGTDLGAMALARDKIMSGKGSGSESAKYAGLSQLGNLAGGAAGGLVGTLFGGGILGGAAGAMLGGGSIQGAIESTFRVKTNPFKEQTFGGVPFRPFEFSWTLTARNAAELGDIGEIIKAIRTHSKPSFQNPESRTIFNYPDEFQINFKTLHTDNETLLDNNYLPRLKPMVCKSVNTNYTTAGWRSFENGAPTSVTLQLGFEEIDIITSDEVNTFGGF